ETMTACDSYTWHGTEYTAGGTPTYQTVNAAGCDSTVTLNLTINYSTTTHDTLVVGSDLLPYNYGGMSIDSAGDYTLALTTTEGCDSTVLLNVQVTVVGIDDVTSVDAISIYPNPTNGNVTIVAEKVLHVEVLDMVGRKVASFDDANTIDISTLPDGNYILRITTPHGIAVRKVTKQ
ncbi:MAG: T9SS type A sorting domain-containing protein, partial [Bacteroidales bacterium]|nr:T9SS type A sorting domain-containing protein [Bacteroidales bacterium]